MTALTQRLEKLTAVQEALLVWGAGFAAILAASAVFGPASAATKVVATVSFLYLPLIAMRRRGEDYRDYGVTLRRWREDLRLFLVLSAIVGPLYLAGYLAYPELLKQLPASWVPYLSPYGSEYRFELRLPPRFGEWVIDQLFVVALPEEFFYRGYLQSRLRDAWPHGRVVLGARLGPAFFLTALLFALGHLAIFEAWRLAVFFPALLFAWMRERTGTVLGAALFHAACNLLEMVLRASFFGR